MTAAAVSHPSDVVMTPVHAKESCGKSPPLASNSADSVLDTATAVRDKSRADAKHGKKAKASSKDSDTNATAKKEKHHKLPPLERCEKRLRAAKRGTRSELSVSGGEWSKNQYSTNPDVLSTANLGDDVPRISAKNVTIREFEERFITPRKPCIITDAMTHWPANHKWTYDRFLARFADHKFKVGSDDDGYAVRLKFSDIHYYVTGKSLNGGDGGGMGHSITATAVGSIPTTPTTPTPKGPNESGSKLTAFHDDSPLYIFDGSFGDKDGSKPLLDEYDVPSYFREDLYGIAGEKRRPPYRWVVIGPPRSGSSVHVDPLATSAWNALISGRKRWCLFPPTESSGLIKSDLKPKRIGLDGESVTWFQKMYPRTKSYEWRSQNKPAPMDVVQNAGEIMYVPDGWWHAVLNLDHTVAVTQNVVNANRFDKVWRMTKRGRPKMSKQWLEKLRVKRPDLYRVALAQPRRGEESADEVTSSSSSSSSSEESSDSEDLYNYAPDAVKDERPGVCDSVLMEMAQVREKRRAAEARSAERARQRKEKEAKKSPAKKTSSSSESNKSKSHSKSAKSPKSRKRSRDVEMAIF